VHPTSTESGIDELDEEVVVPSEMDCSIMSYAASILIMNGAGKVLCHRVCITSSSSYMYQPSFSMILSFVVM